MTADVRKLVKSRKGKVSHIWLSDIDGVTEYHETFQQAYMHALKTTSELFGKSKRELDEITIDGQHVDRMVNSLDKTAAGKVK